MPHSRKASNSSLRVLRQSGADGSFGLRECKEGRGVLLHQAVQRGLLGAVTLVVERAANGRPVGLPTGGLHALLMSKRWCLRGLKPGGASPWSLKAPGSWCPAQGVNLVLGASHGACAWT